MANMEQVRLTRADMVGHKTFMAVRSPVVRKLGGNLAAMAGAAVLSGIEFQMDYGRKGDTYERDGHTWWEASLDVIAEWTGLNRSTVERTLAFLISCGVLVKENHYRGERGFHNRTCSYRFAFADDESTPEPHSEPEPQPEPEPASDSPESSQIPDPGYAYPVHEISHTGHVPMSSSTSEGEGRAAPTPPTSRRFPDQCPVHQAETHYAPCGGCKRARIAHEAQLADARAQQQVVRVMLRCDEHHETYPQGGVCRWCRADEIAIDR